MTVQRIVNKSENFFHIYNITYVRLLFFFEFLNVLFINFFNNSILIKDITFDHKNEMKNDIGLLLDYFLVYF
jgi:hypothetical protein